MGTKEHFDVPLCQFEGQLITEINIKLRETITQERYEKITEMILELGRIPNAKEFIMTPTIKHLINKLENKIGTA